MTFQSPALNDETGVDAPASGNFYRSIPKSKSSHSTISEGQSMVHNRVSIAGKNLVQSGRPPAYAMTQSQWRLRSRAAMREFTGDRAGAAKLIAEVVECSPKTAQSWLDGETTPAGILDLRAMSSIPPYAALKREIAQLEMNLDPRVQAKLMELYQMTMQLAEPPPRT